jgi:hypothetical protein
MSLLDMIAYSAMGMMYMTFLLLIHEPFFGFMHNNATGNNRVNAKD